MTRYELARTAGRWAVYATLILIIVAALSAAGVTAYVQFR
jgi:hypothetical protein